MDTRQQRGLVIAAMFKLTFRNGRWVVPSQSTEKKYVVDAEKKTCDCPDHQETGFVCKHIHAVTFVIQREEHTDGTVTETKSVTFTEKKSYSQNWKQYTKSQMVEKDRLQVLLTDLCQTIPEPDRWASAPGRKPIGIADRIFSVVFKTYCGVSGRRSACDMLDAHEKGYLSQPIHPSKCSAFLCNSDLTLPLQELVSRTSLPLQAIESDFAVDSTGFSVCKFVKWHDEKYSGQRSGREWVKAHAMVGVKTNVVTSVAIYGRNQGDAPILPELVSKTAENFRIKEVSADKGYLSAANVEAISSHGATPFISPRVNTTGSMGGLFEKMIHFYRFNNAEYMQAYHKRSNVESTFSALKRKFGDSVKAKNPVGMVNEVLTKFICHNLSCVIHSQYELGIEANFFPQAMNPIQDDEPAILKFCRPMRA
jgi:transposase